MSKVILLVGPPGVGKSTWIKEYTKNVHVPFVVCSADDYFTKEGMYNYDPRGIGFAHSTCYDKFLNAIRSDVPLIFIDNTNTIREHRSKYVNKAIEYGYEVEIKVFDRSDIELIKARNRSEERVKANKSVPDHVIDRMLGQIDIEPGLWKAEDDGGRSYKVVKTLEGIKFLKKIIREEHEDINKVDDKSVITKEFHHATDIKSNVKDKVKELMMKFLALKHETELLKTGITETEILEPLDDIFASLEVCCHHCEDLIEED